MRLNSQKKKKELAGYIQKIKKWVYRIEEFDWHIYERHKKEVQKICAEDWELYDWAIEKVATKLGI